MDTFTSTTTPKKRTTGRKAVAHALFTEMVLCHETTGSLAAILSALDRELQPEGPAEECYVETMAMARWRQSLARGAIAHSHEEFKRDTPHRSLTEKEQCLENISRLERRAVRSYNGAFRAFKEHRVYRRQAVQASVSELIRS